MFKKKQQTDEEFSLKVMDIVTCILFCMKKDDFNIKKRTHI